MNFCSNTKKNLKASLEEIQQEFPKNKTWRNTQETPEVLSLYKLQQEALEEYSFGAMEKLI